MPSLPPSLSTRGLLAQADGVRAAPDIEIPIPGVTLTSITDPNDYSIPWVGQYIGGVYNFMLSIIGLIAALMMIVGGFQYLTAGGDTSKVGPAKKRVVDALIGLVLAFGSYLLLYTINPELVRFDSFSLLAVKTDALMDNEFTTTAPTSGVGEGAEQASAATGGSYTPKFSTCPLALTDTSMKGIPAFMEAVRNNPGGIITATNPIERALQISDLAVACKVHLGNCGKTVGTFLALGGALSSQECNQSSVTNAGCNTWPRQLYGVPTEVMKNAWWVRCDNDGTKKEPPPACPFQGPWLEYPTKNSCANGTKCQCRRSDCTDSREQAIVSVRTAFTAAAKVRPEMRGWPDAWANQLQPGDWVIIYNGGTSETGTHSVMFQGWTADGKSMRVAQGDGTLGVRSGVWCVRSTCPQSGNVWKQQMPIVRILRP